MRLIFSVKLNKSAFGKPDTGWEVVALDSEEDVDRLRDILAGRPFGHSMMTFRGGHRLAEAAQDRTGILVDFDSDTTYSTEPVTRRRIQDALRPLGCSYILTPSKSHMKEKPAQKTKPAQPAVERWHLYIPFAEASPVTPSLETAVFNLIAKHFGHLDLDPTAFESARYFAPGITTDGMVVAEHATLQPAWLIANYAWGTEARDYKKRVADAKRAAKGQLPSTPARGRTSPKQQRGGEYWRRQQDVQLPGGQIVKASEITEKTPCHCINPEHSDSSPSAFVAFNEDGCQFISCSTCNLTWWEKDWMQPYLDYWFYVDKSLYRFHGDEESEWEPMEVGIDWICAPTPEALAGLKKILRKNALAKQKLKLLRLKAGDQPAVATKNPRSCMITLPVQMQKASKTVPPEVGNPLVEAWMAEMFKEHADFIMNWIALYAFTNEQRLPVLVLNGGRGVGKSSFAEMIARLYPHVSNIWRADKTDFNDELEGSLAHVDELPAAEHGYAESRWFYRLLKSTHGGEKTRINKKYGLRYQVVNNLNLIITTNDMDPIHLDPFETPDDPSMNQFFVYKITREAKVQHTPWNKVKEAFPGWVRTAGKQRHLAWLSNPDKETTRYGLVCPITNDERSAYQNSHTSDELLIPDLWASIDSGYFNGASIRIDRHKGYLSTMDIKNLAAVFGNQKPKWIANTFRRFGWIESATSDRREPKGPVIYGSVITTEGYEMWKRPDPVFD